MKWNFYAKYSRVCGKMKKPFTAKILNSEYYQDEDLREKETPIPSGFGL